MIIIFDNAESILDPGGTGAREVYALVEELSQFETICVCVTSRISTIPQHCERLTIPTLSLELACDIFHGIYRGSGRSDVISNLLGRLDFHVPPITLLATTASHNVWDYDRMAQEWGAHRVQVLRTDYNESLAATIELSLSSPTFQDLGPDARDLLGVVAFFPQGIDEKNLNWLFPAIPDGGDIFDKFFPLSLTYRSGGFITMLAPLRNYLCPQDPTSSLLLQATKKHYFDRVSVDPDPHQPSFEETQWIISKDANVEHVLDVFTTIDADSSDDWDACLHFVQHLHAHKPRLVVLGPKIEGLPDDRSSKPGCLSQLSQLFYSVGNYVEQKRLLIHALVLLVVWGDDFAVAAVLGLLSEANGGLGLREEGIKQVNEALGIYTRLNDKLRQSESSQQLAQLLYEGKQLDAAEEAISRALDLLSDEDNQFRVCECHRILGGIYDSKGKTEKVINHYETGLRIASSFNWHRDLFHLGLGRLFLREGRFADGHAHVELAKSHAVNCPYDLGRAMALQALIWCSEYRLEDAKSEILHAAGVFEKIGGAKELEACRNFLGIIEREMEEAVTSGRFLETMIPPTPVNSPLPAHASLQTDPSANDYYSPTFGRIPVFWLSYFFSLLPRLLSLFLSYW